MEDLPTFWDYKKLNQRLSGLLGSWGQEEIKARKRREIRAHLVDVAAERSKGAIAPDETIIPMRIIDRSISQEKPAQIAYLEKASRILIFTDLDDPSAVTEDLETAFSNAVRYPGWSDTWHRAFDACDLHGGVFLEVVFDRTKPLHARIDYIPREDLIIPLETTNIQACEYVLRRYKFSPMELESFVHKYQWSDTQIRKLKGDLRDTDRTELIEVFKVFLKKDDVVFIAWWNSKCDDWLKPPEPLNLGIYDLQEADLAYTQAQMGLKDIPLPQPLPITDYPLFFLPYELIEDERLLQIKGRASKDAHAQEALTNIWSNVVNATHRASSIYGSTAGSISEPGAAKTTDQVKPNHLYDREVAFWAFPWPDPIILAIADRLSTQKLQETGRVDYAVTNRPDARKTAREIEASVSQAQEQIGVLLSSQAAVITAVYTLVWEIGRSQVILGACTLQVPREKLFRRYRYAPAGDIDVVAKNERKRLVVQLFPYLIQTPLQPILLLYLIQLFFPDKYKAWAPILEQSDPSKLIQSLAEILAAVPRDGLTPQESLQLDQILTMAYEYINSRKPTGSPPRMANTPDNEAAGI